MNDPKKLSPPKMLVDVVMTAGVHRVRPEMKVYEVVELLIGHRISGAPVVDRMDVVISVISEGDLLRLAATEGLEATILHCLAQLPKQKDLVTVKKSDTFVDAYKLFLKHSLHRIIVVDDDGKLTGLVTRADILRSFVEAHHGRKLPTPKN